MTRITTFRPKAISGAKALLISASAIAMASVPAQAAEVLFSSNGITEVAPGTRTVSGSGVLQIRLDSGATLSFVEGAEFTLNDDGSVTLHKGGVTVAGAGNAETRVIMPEGVEGRVGGTGNAASFSVDENGLSSGHTLTGTANISRGRRDREFSEGQMWASSGRSGIRRVMSLGGQATPDAEREVLDVAAGGPAAAAENGLPVSLGDALAAAGASSDVLAIARRVDAANGNPSLEAYPTGDLAALVALAANLEGAYGGQPFPAAQADIIRTYLGYLANGGSGAEFLTAYAGFLTQYLDLVRAGGLPSQFGGASQADINAFLAYQANLGALGNLAAQNQALAAAYLEFITAGGNPDLFASQFTDLVEAYFAFVRGGGNPSEFTGASQELVDAYVAFLAESGLAAQLSAENQEILAAYLESGGFAFAETYAAALAEYFAYLQTGGLPSASGTLTPEQLQAYLELLEGSGLFAQLLGDQAQFYADYLAFLQAGGSADEFGQLNANIFAGYATQLNAYYAYLLGGGLPSNFQGDADLLNTYLAALDDAGALQAFLGANAGFFADYLAFLQGGGNVDAWSGLNANIFAGYADALNAYYSYLAQGGLPSAYTALTQEQIAAYVAALQAQGASSAFLAALSGFYGDYLAYLQGGGDPDVYLGLPALNTQLFADTLDAFGQFLLGGGLPSNFNAADLETLALYIDALERAGQLGLIGSDRDLLAAFFAHFGSGANADQFAGLPIYADYAAALNAYYDFLLAGGLPANYGALTPQQVRDYLAALSSAGGFAAQLGNLSDFYTAYFAHIAGGNDPATFSGLPVYGDYVAALNAYYAFLAGGGLPGDYTALPLATLEAYLDALNAAGGFAAYGNLNAFFTAYYAFVSGGGDPADFSGIPAYADYLAAIADFYAFLAAGGLPSGYTALTQQQIEDYLAALSGAGLLGANFQGDVLAFLNAYFAYLAGGGIPDAFGDLPAAGSGPGFTLAANAKGYLIAPGQSGSANLNGGVVAVNGQPSGFDFSPTGELALDIGGNADGLVGRYASTNLHFMIINPITGSLPATGTVDYAVLAATSPTYSDNATAPGSFAANLTIGFGSSLTYGIDGTITMPDATYTFASPGRSSGQLATPQVADPGFFVIRPVLSQTGSACESNNCFLNMFGALGGASGQTVGFAYQSRDNFNLGQPFLEGSVLFGAQAPAPQDVTLPNQSIAFANPLIGDDVHTLSNVTYNADGIPIGYEANLDPNEALTSGNMVLADTGTAGNGTLAWVRWSDGTPGGNWYNQPLLPVGENGGYHVIAGSPLTNIPTSGAVEYDVIGFTTPTRHDESTSTGSVTGNAAVVFGANPVVALDLTITSGVDVFNLFTDGRLTDPTQSGLDLNPADGMFHTLGVVNGFNGNFDAINVESASSFCSATCNGFVEGFLAGDGASHMGLSYSIRSNTIPNTFIDGSVAFAAGAAINLGGGGGSNTVSTAFGDRPVLAYTYGTTGHNIFNEDTNLFLDGGNYDVLVDGNGDFVELFIDNGFGTQVLDRGTAQVAESYDVGGFQMGRWTDGIIGNNAATDIPLGTNQSAHYVLGDSVLTSFNFPGGTIAYELLEATAPTVQSGNLAPGVFDADLVIDFSSAAAPKAGIEGSVVFSGTNGFTYSFATSGGIAAPSYSLNFDNFSGDDGGRFYILAPGTTDNGLSAELFMFSQLGDAEASTIGMTYRANLLDGSSQVQESLYGAAVFGSTGPVSTGGGTGGTGGGATTSNFTGTRDGIVYYTYTLGSLASGFGGSADLVNGELVNFSSILGTVSKGSASVVEAGDVGALAWGRWVGGTVEARTIVGNTDTVVGANGGYHVMAGTSPTSLPTSGTVNYDLIATTSPTDNLGSAPGTLTGDLAIAFGSINLVGYEFQMDIGGRGYSVSSEGGAANPSASATNLVFSSGTVIFTGNHNSVLPGSVTGTGGACQFSCQVTIGGTLFGSNGGHAGVAMNVFDGGNGVQASGLAIFQAAAPSTGSNPYASAPQTLASVAPASADWDRWEVGSDNISTGNGMAMTTAPGLEALASSGIQYSPEQLAQLEAFYASRNPVD